MSLENTSILATTIPAFGFFLSACKVMKADVDLALDNVVSIISPGLNIAKNYYKKLDDSKSSQFINPSIRMEWIKKK
ncbi:hypothetical protein B0H19DRAFT_1272334 [Mycena capillaripes]|nr:hypothetical protein B0H19DRAFT_1272334 [Mycena capillaripes]